MCAVCDNDGTCESGEDCNNCPNDCVGSSGSAVCGNGVCEPGEDCTSCGDCSGKQNGKFSNRYCCSGTPGGQGGDNPVDCSDNRCSSGGYQCSATLPSFCCGDSSCDAGEDSINCLIDCPAPVCGDSSCDSGEDQCNCAGDCGTPPSSETGMCTDGQDNDCDLLVDCNDSDCAADSACTCGGNGASCSSNGDCCSNKCRGGTCRGN